MTGVLGGLAFRTRVMLVTLASSMVAVAISCLLLAVWQYAASFHELERRNRLVTQVLAGAAAAPVVFEDRLALKDIIDLAAGLPSVHAIAILDRHGRALAARALRAPAVRPPFPGLAGDARIAWHGAAMRITMPMHVTGDVVGWLDLTVDGESFAVLAVRALWITLALLVVASGVAALFVRRLQPLLLRPLQRLLAAMEDVTLSADYSLRVPATADPDVRRLLGAFNAMVAEVERREQALARTLCELEQARDAAEAANTAKSQFLAGMSHELRTPLNAVIGYAELLMVEIREDGDNRLLEDLQVIDASAKHLLVLINGVLDFAKIEARQMALDVHPFDPNPLLREVAATLRPLAARNGNAIELVVDEPLPTMLLDSTKLRQCLLNLGANACKFTKDGQIRIVARHLAAGDAIELAVRDTGIGIPAHLIERLFVPFSQVDTSTTRRFGGTGLGLAITDEFARMMNGRVEVDSVEGAGSTFTITLPRRWTQNGSAA